MHKVQKFKKFDMIIVTILSTRSYVDSTDVSLHPLCQCGPQTLFEQVGYSFFFLAASVRWYALTFYDLTMRAGC